MPGCAIIHCVRWEHEKYHNQIRRKDDRRIEKISRKRQTHFVGIHKKIIGGTNTMPLRVVELISQIEKLVDELKKICETTPLDICICK